ncbi:MAG: hypothetical protein IKO76_00980 [Butyrivibrio sp.]|nr:hypothetical protein [Butyrivibrio sp.]
MTVDELITKCDETKKAKKSYDFAQHLTMKYMPYSEKAAMVKNIIDATSYVDVEHKRGYKRDTPNMVFIFTMKLIVKYTDIDISPENVVSDYDKLMESGIMHELTDQIPESEVKIIRGMLDMSRDDLEMNTRSLVSFLETKADALQIAMDGLSKVLEKPEIQSKLAEIKKDK